MIVFTPLYGALAVVEVKLFLHYVRKGAEQFVEPPIPPDQTDDDAPARLRLLRGGRHGADARSGSSSSPSSGPGYFVLEGFDFGVGMLLPVLGAADADDTERRGS